MSKFTLNQASKACNKSKSAILNAISTGRLSAVKGDTGQWEIQAAELFRVYPPTSISTTENLPDIPPIEHQSTPVLLERLAGYEREIKRLEEERNYLHSQLAEEKQERRKLTQMLTHQKQESINATPEKGEPGQSRLYQRIFGRRC